MKKTLLAATILLASTAAMAQSSVTLYGLVNAGVDYSTNQGGAHNFAVTSGTVDESFFGLKGSEDLGGGVKTVFDLEEGFNVANGQYDVKNEQFSRQAFVGLSSDKLGTVTVGRQWDAFSDQLAPLALTGTDQGGVIAAHPFDNDNLNETYSVANAVKYQTPTINGLTAEAEYGFGNGNQSRSYSVGASYVVGGLTVAGGYLNNNNPGYGNGGAVDNESTFVADKQETWGAGASYNFGKVTTGAVVTQSRLKNTVGVNAGEALGGYAMFTNYEVNATYALTPALTVAGAYTFTDSRLNGADPKWNQVTLQADYSLSKRTSLYVEGVYQRVNDSNGITADINGLAPSTTGSQAVVATGIIHRF
jgi:general bacterial porin, GBP family